MMQFLSNAFNDPSDPWYYIIGVIFLLLIFGAVGAYVFWTGKRKNSKAADAECKDEEEQKDDKPEPDAADVSDNQPPQEKQQAAEQEQKDTQQN